MPSCASTLRYIQYSKLHFLFDSFSLWHMPHHKRLRRIFCSHGLTWPGLVWLAAFEPKNINDSLHATSLNWLTSYDDGWWSRDIISYHCMRFMMRDEIKIFTRAGLVVLKHIDLAGIAFCFYGLILRDGLCGLWPVALVRMCIIVHHQRKDVFHDQTYRLWTPIYCLLMWLAWITDKCLPEWKREDRRSKISNEFYQRRRPSSGDIKTKNGLCEDLLSIPFSPTEKIITTCLEDDTTHLFKQIPSYV